MAFFMRGQHSTTSYLFPSISYLIMYFLCLYTIEDIYALVHELVVMT